MLTRYLRPEWPRVVLLGMLLVLGISLQLANPQIVKLFIDRVQAGAPFEQLVPIAVVFLGVATIATIATIGETYVAEDLGWRTTNVLRADLTRHVLDLDSAFHGEHNAGELIERIDGDVSAIAGFFARFVVQVVGNSLFLVGMLILLFREDWRIGLVLSLATACALVYMSRGGGAVASRSRDARQAAADVSGYVEERLAGLPDLKTSGADAYAVQRLDEHLGRRYACVTSSVMAGQLYNSVVGVLFVLGSGAALALGVALYGAGIVTLGTLYVVFRYAGMLREPLYRLTRHMNTALRATGAIERVDGLLHTHSGVVDGPGADVPAGALAVTFDGVSFAYGAEPVLRDVSCDVQSGTVLGLLGRTGSGKTTMARLLFRLHDPTAGSVRLSGVDIRNALLDQVRTRVGLVTQDVQLFHATLRDNVTLFDPTVTDARLIEVFAELGLTDWLRKLEDGFDTLLGGAGRGLSAGEAQLIALARVFLKDPGLVVLDEASSRLDPETERLLEGAVSRLLAGRTGIVIAHRLATVERADAIVILEDGAIVEQGRRSVLATTPESRFARLLRAGMGEELA